MAYLLWATYFWPLTMGFLLWTTYYGLSHELLALLTMGYQSYLLTMVYQPYLLWLQVAYLDCYAMRFVKPHAAATAGAVATSDLPPLPLQYSLGAEKVSLAWTY